MGSVFLLCDKYIYIKDHVHANCRDWRSSSYAQVWFQNRRTKWRKKSATEPSSTQAGHAAGQSGEASENEVEDEEYNKPLDPDSDDDKIRLLLRKHRRAFSVLRLGPNHVWQSLDSTSARAIGN